MESKKSRKGHGKMYNKKVKKSFVGKMYNKKAVSLMLSYVILVSIIIAMSITIFAWLKLVANIEPIVSCEEGSSIIVYDYFCKDDKFILTLKNNGLFNIDGFILSVGSNTQRAPIVHLIPFIRERGSIDGRYFFETALGPEETSEAVFTNTGKEADGSVGVVGFKYIRNIRIQPFIIESGERIVCEEAVIRQDIDDCEINKNLEE